MTKSELKAIHFESQVVGRRVQSMMERGTSLFNALAVAADEARLRQLRILEAEKLAEKVMGRMG